MRKVPNNPKAGSSFVYRTGWPSATGWSMFTVPLAAMGSADEMDRGSEVVEEVETLTAAVGEGVDVLLPVAGAALVIVEDGADCGGF